VVTRPKCHLATPKGLGKFKLWHSLGGTPKHTQRVIDVTQKETALDKQQHSCEKLICQRHQTILRLLSSTAMASTRWRVREHYCQTTYIKDSYLPFVHLSVCLTTGPQPLPKPAIHIVRSRASSFICEYPLLSLRSSSSFLHLLSRLPVTSIPLFIFPLITCYRRQFLHKMWPISLAFRLLISCRIFFFSLILSNTSSFLTWSLQLIFFILLQHHISYLSRCFWSTARSVQVTAPYKATLQIWLADHFSHCITIECRNFIIFSQTPPRDNLAVNGNNFLISYF
jgi:hypothetical protein